MFGKTTFGNQTPSFGFSLSSSQLDLKKDVEIIVTPEDTVSSLEFSPVCQGQKNHLAAGSWDNCVRCYEVDQSGTTLLKVKKKFGGPVLDICWSDDGANIFAASTDKEVKLWDLNADNVVQVGVHDAPIKTCHFVNAMNTKYLMTGSWDKTLKFWDMRTPTPMLVLPLSERCYCVDVDYPLAVVGTADLQLTSYSLENYPRELNRGEMVLKQQLRAVAIFRDKKNLPAGYAAANTEGRVSIQYINPTTPKDNFAFKCHRVTDPDGTTNIYSINDLRFHPVHRTLATAGSDGTFAFWDKDGRTKLKKSGRLENAVTKCAFNSSGQIFAYAIGYDWSKGYEFNNILKKPQIYLHPCFEDTRPRRL